MCAGKQPVGVALSDGEHARPQDVPGAPDEKDLALEAVEHVVLDALTSSARPQWPAWRLLVEPLIGMSGERTGVQSRPQMGHTQ